MTTARNDITGDIIATKGTSEAFRSNYDAIFGKKNKQLQADIVDTSGVKALYPEDHGLWFEDSEEPQHSEEENTH